jgi:hypothetical protein
MMVDLLKAAKSQKGKIKRYRKMMKKEMNNKEISVFI